MAFYCVEDFESQIAQLKKKNSYREIELDLIEYFFDKPFEELRSGTRLNNSDISPYIKKRIVGRGGYRCYYLVKGKDIFISFIHPKTGSLGYENISNEARAEIQKEIYEAIKGNKLMELTKSNNGQNLVFKKKTK